MADNAEQHKSKWMTWETFQNVLIIIGLIAGWRGRPEPGSEEEKRVPAWILANLDFLTHEDEILHAQARSSYNRDPRFKEIEATFVKRIERDGYAPNKYRALIAGMWQKFLDQVRQPAPENKSAGHLDYQPTTVGNPCLSFFDDLVTADAAGGTPEEKYERQKKAAEGFNLLVKKSLLQKIREHPWFFLMMLLSGLIALFNIAYEIIYWILG